MLLSQVPPFGLETSLAQPLTCEVVTDVAAAEELVPAWSDLLQRSERRELMQTPDWLLTWWRVFGSRVGANFGSACFGQAPASSGWRRWYTVVTGIAIGCPSADSSFSGRVNQTVKASVPIT